MFSPCSLGFVFFEKTSPRLPPFSRERFFNVVSFVTQSSALSLTLSLCLSVSLSLSAAGWKKKKKKKRGRKDFWRERRKRGFFFRRGVGASESRKVVSFLFVFERKAWRKRWKIIIIIIEKKKKKKKKKKKE